MASEGAKLALIATDDTAMRVLAAWACAGLALSTIDEQSTLDTIARLAGVGESRCADVLCRLQAIGCLRDGDISELADRLLQQRVMSSAKRNGKR